MIEESDSSQTSNEQHELERRTKGHAVLALCYASSPESVGEIG